MCVTTVCVFGFFRAIKNENDVFEDNARRNKDDRKRGRRDKFERMNDFYLVNFPFFFVLFCPLPTIALFFFVFVFVCVVFVVLICLKNI